MLDGVDFIHLGMLADHLGGEWIDQKAEGGFRPGTPQRRYHPARQHQIADVRLHADQDAPCRQRLPEPLRRIADLPQDAVDQHQRPAQQPVARGVAEWLRLGHRFIPAWFVRPPVAPAGRVACAV